MIRSIALLMSSMVSERAMTRVFLLLCSEKLGELERGVSVVLIGIEGEGVVIKNVDMLLEVSE